MNYEIKPNHEHFDIYIDGHFYCSVDNMAEAREEIEKISLTIQN